MIPIWTRPLNRREKTTTETYIMARSPFLPFTNSRMKRLKLKELMTSICIDHWGGGKIIFFCLLCNNYIFIYIESNALEEIRRINILYSVPKYPGFTFCL